MFALLSLLILSRAEGSAPDLWYGIDPESFRRLLPPIYILPLAEHIKPKAVDADFKLENEHSHDVLFLSWLLNDYEQTTRDGGSAKFFFLPAHNPTTKPYKDAKSDVWWRDVDRELEKIAESGAMRSFALDKVLFASSFPISVKRFITASFRNIADVRTIRVDNDLTMNGRDVFVPYILNPLIWSFNYSDTSKSKQQKKFFLAAICREAGGFLDAERIWRTKLYNQWRTVENSMVVYSVAKPVFQHAFTNSDFCVILPGDTGSTAKLYMAIFSGCIPVVFVSFKKVLPFVHFLDWTLFSVPVLKDIINSKAAMRQLLSYLNVIRNNPSRLERYKVSLASVAHLFDFGKRNWPSVYHLTMLEFARDYKLKSQRNEGSSDLGNYLL